MNLKYSRFSPILANSRNLYIGLLLIILPVAGCTHIAYSTQSPTISSTVTISSHQTASQTLTSTEAILALTTSPRVSPSQTPFSTWTSLPTLSDSQAEAQWLKWLKGTTDCLLPCWGGITPGKTSWQETKQILGSVLNILDTNEEDTCTFGPCKVIMWKSRSGVDPSGVAISQNNAIDEIILQGYPPSPIMRLDNILKQYGPPEKIFIFTNPVFTTMDITLAYPNHGFIVMYIWNQTTSHENIVSCIQEGRVYLSVNQVAETWSDSYIKNKVYGNGDMSEVDFRTLESVTNMTIEQFYEQFRDIDGSECIVAPFPVWQP
jgi:hypothetical protein